MGETNDQSLVYILIAFVLVKVVTIKDHIERLIAVCLFSVILLVYIGNLFMRTGDIDIWGILLLIGFLVLYMIRGGKNDIAKLRKRD